MHLLTSFVLSLDFRFTFVVCLSSVFFRVLLTCFFLGAVCFCSRFSNNCGRVFDLLLFNYLI